jgi:probable addiction module antidote protein
MAKKKTSSKQKVYSASDVPIGKLKSGVKTRKFDSAFSLHEMEAVLGSLMNCLAEGDHETFKEVLASALETVNKAKLSKATGMSRNTIHRSVSEQGNPTLSTIAQLVHALKVSADSRSAA